MADLSHLPAAWRRSGLSQRAFCERDGIKLATFSYWRAKERRGELPGRSSVTPAAPGRLAPSLLPVVVAEAPPAPPTPTPPAIEIHYPDGTRVTIPFPSAAPC